MAMSTDADVKVYEPNILAYGIQSFTSEHAKTQADIERLLRIDWWPRVRNTKLSTNIAQARYRPQTLPAYSRTIILQV